MPFFGLFAVFGLYCLPYRHAPSWRSPNFEMTVWHRHLRRQLSDRILTDCTVTPSLHSPDYNTVSVCVRVCVCECVRVCVCALQLSPCVFWHCFSVCACAYSITITCLFCCTCLQGRQPEALSSFAEDVYYCSLEYGPEDPRTSLGFYNMGKVWKGARGVLVSLEA